MLMQSRHSFLRRIRLGQLVALLCGIQFLAVISIGLCYPVNIAEGAQFVFVLGAFNTTILTSTWIGLGGRISPWRLVILVLVGLPAVWLCRITTSDILREVPVVWFFLTLAISGVFLVIHFFGWQLRTVRRPKRLQIRRKHLRHRQSIDTSKPSNKPAIQFTLRGMLIWTAVWALVLGALSSLWPAFSDAINPTLDDLLIFCWFALFSPIVLWMACGIGFFPLRIIAFVVGTWIGSLVLGDPRELSVLLCLWTWMVFLLFRIAGFRFLRVRRVPPLLCASASLRES